MVSVSGMFDQPRRITKSNENGAEEIRSDDFHALVRDNEELRSEMERLREEVDTLTDVVQKLQGQLDFKNAKLQEISARCEHYKAEKQQIEGVAEERLLKWTQCSAQLAQLVMNSYQTNEQTQQQLIPSPETVLPPKDMS